MKIRITKSYEGTLNGVDVISFCKGKVIDLSDGRAATLIEKGYAEEVAHKPYPALEDKAQDPVEENKGDEGHED